MGLGVARHRRHRGGDPFRLAGALDSDAAERGDRRQVRQPHGLPGPLGALRNGGMEGREFSV